MFNVEYYPEDIAENMLYLTERIDTEPEKRKQVNQEITDCLYWIQAAAGNEYNQDYWRTFYRTLENICYLIECKSIQ